MISIITTFIGIIIGVVITKIASSKTTFAQIKNDNKKTSSDSTYYLLKTEHDETYLFTKEQVEIAKERAEKNPEDTDI